MGERLNIKVVLAIALVFRLALLFPIISDTSLMRHNDTASYLDVSINVIKGNGYSHCIDEPYFFDSIRTPVYPFFLALCFGVFKEASLLVLFIHLLLDLGTVFLVYKIGTVLSERRIGVFAALFYALSIHAASYSGLMIPECLYTFLFTLLVYCLVKKPVASKLVLVLLCTFLCYLRPISMYALVLFIPYIVIYPKQLKSLLIPFFTLLLLIPWMIMMRSETGHFTFTSISSYNIYATYANALASKQNNSNEVNQRDKLLNEMESPVFGDCKGDYRYISEMKEKGLEIIFNDPVDYAFVHLRSWPNAFLPEVSHILKNWGLVSNNKGTLSVINQKGIIEGVRYYFSDNIKAAIVGLPILLLWLFLLICFVMGIYRGYGYRYIALMMIVIVFYSLIPGPATTSRFLMPVIPLMCLIAGMGLNKKLKWRDSN